MYKIMPLDAMQPHDTWIIAFCPDTDSFFVTNQRAFFWQYEKEFESEESAISYFENHIEFFLEIDNEIMNKFIGRTVDCVLLENTNKWYK